MCTRLGENIVIVLRCERLSSKTLRLATQFLSYSGRLWTLNISGELVILSCWIRHSGEFLTFVNIEIEQTKQLSRAYLTSLEEETTRDIILDEDSCEVMDDATWSDNFVIRALSQALLALILVLWLGLHVLMGLMVVVVSIIGRMSRWIGGWRADLGMNPEPIGVKRKNRFDRISWEVIEEED
ncbi:hypothetical protein BDZ45DRAFT_410972 [Acephala macrosclerotiorum]|nr:hypothetical protein BDZ45DRAFT_410972 [Acephala macrosclerotiorum]